MAATSFNRAWDLLEKMGRSREDDLTMLSLAHASRCHWALVGTQLNRAVGDWQISRVYAALGEPGLALQYAKMSLAACEENGLGEIIPSACEAVARAYAVAHDPKNAGRYLSKARRLLDRLPIGKDDREIYLGQIEDTQRLINEI